MTTAKKNRYENVKINVTYKNIDKDVSTTMKKVYEIILNSKAN